MYETELFKTKEENKQEKKKEQREREIPALLELLKLKIKKISTKEYIYGIAISLFLSMFYCIGDWILFKPVENPFSNIQYIVYILVSTFVVIPSISLFLYIINIFKIDSSSNAIKKLITLICDHPYEFRVSVSDDNKSWKIVCENNVDENGCVIKDKVPHFIAFIEFETTYEERVSAIKRIVQYAEKKFNN